MGVSGKKMEGKGRGREEREVCQEGTEGGGIKRGRGRDEEGRNEKCARKGKKSEAAGREGGIRQEGNGGSRE